MQRGEETFREDERQACWEDFMYLLNDVKKNRTKPSALYASMFNAGWKEFGTGDGKPMHRYENSFVNRRALAERTGGGKA